VTARRTTLSVVSLAARVFSDGRPTDSHGSNISLDISCVFETMACLFVQAFGDDSLRLSTIVSALLRANSGIPSDRLALGVPA
jgi:hypothetical protein